MKRYNIIVTTAEGVPVSHETLEGDKIAVVAVAETDTGPQKCELEWKFLGDEPGQIIGEMIKGYVMGKIKIPGFHFGRQTS